MYCFRACVVRYSLVSGNLVAECRFLMVGNLKINYKVLNYEAYKDSWQNSI